VEPGRNNWLTGTVRRIPEGYTKVLVGWTYGVGLADGGIYWDTPTSVIPLHLGRIGSRFIVQTTSLQSQREAKKMTAEEMRSTQHVSVEEIQED
jgi:hypothetical protein